MSDLPESWVEVPIGTVARIVGGGTPPSKDPANFAKPSHGIPWLTPADLSGYRKQTIERGARDLTEAGFSACGATLMPKGTVLFSSRAPIGYVAIAANDISTNQGFKSFIFPPGISSRFTYYQLKWLKPEAEAIATGTTFKELSGAATATLPFKVAPAGEQIRIADQLDTLLTRIQSCNDRFDAIPALLKRFRQAVLDAVVAGNLTHSWRVERNAADWSTTKVSSICQERRVITYGVVKLGGEVPNGTPCLRTSNVRWLRFELDGMKRIAPSLSAEYSRTILRGGEVLVNVRGTLGGVAVARDEMAGWNISREVAVLPVDPNVVNPLFVAYWVASNTSQKWLARMEKGIAYVGINIEDLRSLPIRLPSLQEQAEIVRRVEALFALADRIEAQTNSSRARAQRLSPLVLSKAFRGELVQQDPQDESADVLLQRIAATKPAKMAASRGRFGVEKTRELLPQPVAMQADWAALPNGVWAASSDFDEHATAALLVAVLRAWDQPIQQAEARLTAVLCQQPRLLTAALPAHQTAHWRRLVGSGADLLPQRVAIFQPAINSHWRKALAGMRARGDLVESGTGPQSTWALGAGTEHIETTGWPEGRAGWVVAYLRAHGVDAILPLLESEAREFVHARAA